MVVNKSNPSNGNSKNNYSKPIIIVVVLMLVVLAFLAGMLTENFLYRSDHDHKPYPDDHVVPINPRHDGLPTVEKPLIYIYPTQPTKVEISVSNPNDLTTTYPKYQDGWKVLAKPNGMLKQLGSDRNYYGLYWESKTNQKTDFYDGFVVKKADLIPFLEEKLAILGLNQREANEFIVYWLPKLEKNDYNLIRFLTADEINQKMRLDIKPRPDSLIRVMMQFESTSHDKQIKQQILQTVTRQGYTVVEWGGVSD